MIMMIYSFKNVIRFQLHRMTFYNLNWPKATRLNGLHRFSLWHSFMLFFVFVFFLMFMHVGWQYDFYVVNVLPKK